MDSAYRITTTCFVVLVSGCALRPQLPDDVDKPFAVQVANAVTPVNSKIKPEHIAKALDLMKQHVAARLRTVHGQQWSYAEATTAGGVGAVVGTIADKVGLLNTGIATILGGATLNGFYQPQGQMQVHLKADMMLGCMRNALSPLRDSDENDASLSPAAKTGKVLSMNDLIYGVQAGLDNYRNTFYSRTVTALTRDEILALAGKVKETNDIQNKAASNEVVLRELKRSQQKVKDKRDIVTGLTDTQSKVDVKKRSQMNSEVDSAKVDLKVAENELKLIESTLSPLLLGGVTPTSSDEASKDQAYSRMSTAISDIEVCSKTLKSST